MSALGVDAWRGGWVAARVEGRRVVWATYPTFSDLGAAHPDGPVGVDIPIGLLDGPRACDALARRVVGRRTSSVFPAPTRAHLAAARAGAPYGPGLGVSAQAWNLLPRIAEVDEHLARTGRTDVVEVHPEASFAVLAGAPLEGKKTARGAGQRLAALARAGFVVDLAAAPPAVPVDDVLDAVAVLWTAVRIAAGDPDLRTYPAGATGPPRIVV